MNNTITGRVICAGRLKDNNEDEFYGLMIECNLQNVAVPLYQNVFVCKDDGNAMAIDEEKKKLIDHIIQTKMSAANCRAMIELSQSSPV